MTISTVALRRIWNPRISLIAVARCIAVSAIVGIICCAFAARAFPRTPGGSAVSSQQSGAGAVFNAEATAKDVGLPVYPGARPHKDKDDDKSSAKFGLWGSSFAFKLAVVKLETNDSPEKVAAFYKKALAKYGTVLDCRNVSSHTGDKAKEGGALDCESDQPEPGNMTFKAGTKEKQHVVGIERNGNGSIIKLVYVESPD